MLLSTLWGFLAGVAAFAIFVGKAASPPSVSLALAVTLPLTLVGLLLGLLRLRAERRLLRRLDRYSPPPAQRTPATAGW
jgi:hypothetical protein